jgi:hypothetical protein
MAAMPYERASHDKLISAGPSCEILKVTGCSEAHDVHPHRFAVDNLMQ